MKKSIWPAVLAGLLVLPAAAQAADSAPKTETAAVKLVQMEKGAAYMDESSVHIVDASEEGVVAEVMILRSEDGRRTSVTRAAYRISGGQKDAVRSADGAWETVEPDSFDAVCAARIRTILNDPLRQAQFVDEIQQALMKRWEAKEAAKNGAGVVVSIEPAETKNAPQETTPEASEKKETAPDAAAAAKEPAAEAKPNGQPAADREAKRGEKTSAEAKQTGSGEPGVVVEITSREPEVTVEILPEAPVRAGAEGTAPAAGV